MERFVGDSEEPWFYILEINFCLFDVSTIHIALQVMFLLREFIWCLNFRLDAVHREDERCDIQPI